MHSMISLFYMLRLRCSKGCAGQVYERDEILFDQLKYGYFMSCFSGTETEERWQRLMSLRYNSNSCMN